MKEQLSGIVEQVCGAIHSGAFKVDYRNKAFVRVVMDDGLVVDLHKYGDVCLTFKGEGTRESYLLAKKTAISEEMSKAGEEMKALREEMKEVEKELRAKE